MDPNDDACEYEDWLMPFIRAVQEEQPSVEQNKRSFVDLFDADEVRRKLPSDGTIEFGESDSDSRAGEARSSSDAILEWEAKLRSILHDARGPKRQLLIADNKLLGRLSAVESRCPGFELVSNFILRAANLSMTTASPMRLQPLLLVGPPGVGKTHFVRRLATALGVPLEFIAGDLLSDRGVITGLSVSWRAARPGRIASALLESSFASPLFVLDEVDKVSPINHREEPLAFLHTVLDEGNAQKFTDEYLSFSMRADHCFWILTANQTEMLPPSILDRLLVIQIKAPDHAAMMRIARNIYKEANARHSNWFEEEPEDAVINTLARYNPRKASKIVEFAFGFAAEEIRKGLTPKNVTDAVALIEHGDAPRCIGFLPTQSD